MAQIWDSVINGAGDVLGLYAQVERLKLDQGMARSQQQIAEWNAQAPALSMQMQAQQDAMMFGLEGKKVMLIGAGVLVLGLVAFMAFK